YLYVLVPALAVFVFHLAPSSLWRSAWRVGALTLLHLAAVRFLWPVGTSEAEYLQYTVSSMSQDRLIAITIFCAVLGLAGIAVARLDLGALNPARRARAQASAGRCSTSRAPAGSWSSNRLPSDRSYSLRPRRRGSRA